MTYPMGYACLMGGLRQTPYLTGELICYGLVSLTNIRLHARAAIPRAVPDAAHSIHPTALFGRGVGTTLPQPACSPEGHCLHTHLIPNSRIYRLIELRIE